MSEDTKYTRQFEVLKALYGRTQNGFVDWQPTAHDSTFTSESGGFVLKLRAAYDSEYPEKPDYYLDIYSGNKKIETISHSMLRGESSQHPIVGNTPYGMFEKLFEMARRKAFNVDTALDKLLESLSED